MEQIGMFDAKTRFSEIARQVKETGRRVLVTNRGEEMVEIGPVTRRSDRQEAHAAAVRGIHDRWRTLPKITREDVRLALDEGRR